MTDPNIIAEGGFNSGRLYRADGQKIYWWQFDDGWLFFSDISRMGYGFIDRSQTAPALLREPIVEGWLMRRYDKGLFTTYREGRRDTFAHQLTPPADFDFGKPLNI